MQAHHVDPDGELPLDEIMEAFMNHSKEHPLIFMINPVYQEPILRGWLGKKSIAKIPAPKMKIFPGGKVKRGDYSQGVLGNCYLISTLDALLAHKYGPKVIAGFIRDLSPHSKLLGKEFENKVMVRVFYPYVDSDNRSPTYNQDMVSVGYLVFDKSVFITNKRAIGFPIAQLLEQAVSFMFNNNIAEEGFGEHPDRIYQILFGEYINNNLNITKENLNNYRRSLFDVVKSQGSNVLLLELSRYHPKNPVKERDYVLSATLAKIKKDYLDDIIKKHWPKENDTPINQLQDFTWFASAAIQLPIYKNDPEVKILIDLLIDYGRGLLDPSYRAKHHSLIAAINNAFSENKLVNIATIENLSLIEGRAATHEPISRGIVGNHAYAVTGLSKKKNIEGIKAEFLPIRNPWGAEGNYGSTYYIFEDSLQPASNKQSEFEIEVKHLEKVIEKVSISITAITEKTATELSQRAVGSIKDKNIKSLNQHVKMTFVLADDKRSGFRIEKHIPRKHEKSRGLAEVINDVEKNKHLVLKRRH